MEIPRDTTFRPQTVWQRQSLGITTITDGMATETSGHFIPAPTRDFRSLVASVLKKVVVVGGKLVRLISLRCKAPDSVLTKVVVVVRWIGSPNTIEKLNIL